MFPVPPGPQRPAPRYDNHVAELLEQALYHVEHPRLGLRDTPAAAVAASKAH